MAKTLRYDINGNLTNTVTTATTNNYEWDAVNRLLAVVTITDTGTNRSEFTYDGLSRRVGIVEKTNGVVTSEKRYLWVGSGIVEERDATGATVTKRFFGQGEQISGTSYFYTRDHLGSIRELTDEDQVVQARYDYDPYGRITKLSGARDATFGYTGHFRHENSGLWLTLFRVYDPESGRWLSRDPLGEAANVNLYEYSENNPLNLWDPFGGDAYKVQTPGFPFHQGVVIGSEGNYTYTDFGPASGGWALTGKGKISTSPLNNFDPNDPLGSAGVKILEHVELPPSVDKNCIDVAEQMSAGKSPRYNLFGNDCMDYATDTMNYAKSLKPKAAIPPPAPPIPPPPTPKITAHYNYGNGQGQNQPPQKLVR